MKYAIFINIINESYVYVLVLLCKIDTDDSGRSDRPLHVAKGVCIPMQNAELPPHLGIGFRHALH